jgi:hypothetical protein
MAPRRKKPEWMPVCKKNSECCARKNGSVTNTEAGMVFAAGPVTGDDASHAVLWTRQSFSDDLKVEWDFTRPDTINRYVNIIHLQATGIEMPPYSRDIAEWSSLRQAPSMKLYFNPRLSG